PVLIGDDDAVTLFDVEDARLEARVVRSKPDKVKRRLHLATAHPLPRRKMLEHDSRDHRQVEIFRKQAFAAHHHAPRVYKEGSLRSRGIFSGMIGNPGDWLAFGDRDIDAIG